MKKYPKLVCTRYNYTFSEGWEVVWFPIDPADHRGGFEVTAKHHHERGGDSVVYGYSGPPSLVSSIHLIKLAIKRKDLPKNDIV